MEKITNSLTKDQIDQIKEADDKMREARKIKALCNHRSIDGTGDAIIFNKINGVVKCKICGATFKPIDSDLDIKEIQTDAQNIIDYIQTIKIMNPNMDKSIAESLYTTIPVLEDLGNIFKDASDHLHKEEYYGFMKNHETLGAVQMMNETKNLLSTYQKYMEHQPMRDGEEIRSFFDEIREEEKNKDEEDNKNE